MTTIDSSTKVSSEAIAEILLPYFKAMQQVTDNATAEDRVVIETFIKSLTTVMGWIVDDSNTAKRDLEAATVRAAQAERRLAATAENYATLQVGFTGKPVSAADVLAFTDRLLELEDTVGHAGDYDIPPELRPLYPPLV